MSTQMVRKQLYIFKRQYLAQTRGLSVAAEVIRQAIERVSRWRRD